VKHVHSCQQATHPDAGVTYTITLAPRQLDLHRIGKCDPLHRDSTLVPESCITHDEWNATGRKPCCNDL
jgi:hypothetical protein